MEILSGKLKLKDVANGNHAAKNVERRGLLENGIPFNGIPFNSPLNEICV